MKSYNRVLIGLILGVFFMTSCTREDEDIVNAISTSEYPQVIYFDDEGDGEIEDEDKMSVKLVLLDRIDLSGDNLGGSITPLSSDATISFIIKDFEGNDNIANYIKDWEAFYEIDDCTSSSDLDIDLNLTVDLATGIGSVIFPANVEEIELEFELDEALFDDEELNSDRGFVVELTDVVSAENVKVNTDIEFEYDVLDNEAIYGDWELDHTDSDQLANFMQLFNLINADISDLTVDDIDKIEFAFKYDELEIVIELVEEELVEECGESEMENIKIEIAMEYDDLTTDDVEGDASFEDSIEQEDGSEIDFKYEGSFTIESGQLTLVLEGEYDDETADETTIVLEK